MTEIIENALIWKGFLAQFFVHTIFGRIDMWKNRATRREKALNQVLSKQQAPVSAPQVVRRELLWSGGESCLFRVRIPTAAMPHSLEGNVSCVRIIMAVLNGYVNIYVHCHEPSYMIGKEVNCFGEVWELTYANGRKEICVEFHKHDTTQLPTHVWRVVQGKVPIIPKGFQNTHRFPTPEPLEGSVVIGERVPNLR